MLMDRLALVVVFGMGLTIWASNSLRGFVRLEAQITSLMVLGLLLVSQAAIAEHQVVMCLQVFRVNREYGVQRLHRICVFPLKEHDAAVVVQRHAVTRVLRQHSTEFVSGAVVISV